MLTKLQDTKATVELPQGPARRPGHDGWDWMANVPRPWSVIGVWGEEGYDIGDWPYVIYALGHAEVDGVEYFGYTKHVEGDIYTYWFAGERNRDLAVSEEARWDWSHTSGGEKYKTVEDMPLNRTVPYGRKTGYSLAEVAGQ